MIKSLRWRLQIWHAVLLTVVLAVFGSVVYNLHWQTRRQQIDADLDRRAEVLVAQLRRMFSPFGGAPRRSRDDTRPNPVPAGTPAPPNDRPPREPFRDSRPPRGSDRQDRPDGPPEPSPRSLPDDFQHVFEGDEGARYYFVIWGRDGHLLKQSPATPVVPYPDLRPREGDLPTSLTRSRGLLREVVHTSRYDLNILVGRSIADDIAAERRYGAWLFLVGSGVLVAGLLGGGWMSDRVVKPISAMTATAQSISAQNLTERIDLTETETELGQLATVLNGAFDRLQSAFEQQSRFTADASHELRTPLSVIMAHTELALSRERTTEEYRKTLETCQRASTRMKSLIEDLLTLARFDSGQPSLELTEFDLGPVIQECVEMLQPLAAARGIRLEMELAPTRIRADRGRVLQVLLNLITNAIRYNRDGGSVHVIATNSDDSGTVIKVTDTGVGIASSDIPHLFERFYRVDKARSRSDGGSGLGLSICKTIVEAHQGTMRVSSELGSGTTVEVRLPVRMGKV